MKLKTEL